MNRHRWLITIGLSLSVFLLSACIILPDAKGLAKEQAASAISSAQIRLKELTAEWGSNQALAQALIDGSITPPESLIRATKTEYAQAGGGRYMYAFVAASSDASGPQIVVFGMGRGEKSELGFYKSVHAYLCVAFSPDETHDGQWRPSQSECPTEVVTHKANPNNAELVTLDELNLKNP